MGVGPAARVPATPQGAFAGGAAPGTPGAASLQAPAAWSSPGTPGAAFQQARVPQMVPVMVPVSGTPARSGTLTPVGVGRAAPFTPGLRPLPMGYPGGGQAPGTPGMQMAPSTPAGRNPGTPGLQMVPATPAGRNPGTPGAQMAPGTPGARVFGAGGGRQPATGRQAPGMTPVNSFRSGLSTPVNMPHQMQMVPQGEPAQARRARRAAPMFSDGTSSNLRYAPRRDRQTGKPLPPPATPASVPKHWTNPVAGSAPKPKPEEPVPNFQAWQQKKDEAAKPGGKKR